jgi:predicted PurR-regulated permease PerM
MTGQQRAVVWVAGLGFFLLAVFLLRGVLLPFVAGMAVAYFLDPACDWLEEKGCSRTVATSIITGVFFLIAGALLVLIAPLAYGQVVEFVGRVPGYTAAIRDKAAPLLSVLAPYFGDGGVDDLRQTIGSYTGDAVRWAMRLIGRLLTQLDALASLLSLIVITPIVSFYLLRDWDHLVARIDNWLPRGHAATIRQQFVLIDGTLAGFVRGQVIVCLLLGLFYGVALTAVGLDFGFIIGFATGLVSFVPYFGMLLGFAVGMAVAIAQFDSWTLILLVAAVFAVGQVMEGNFLTPKLVGERVGLHAVWIIFALLAGGALFGFVGILLAVPVAAVIGVLARFAVGQYLQSPLYLAGAPPEPPPEAPAAKPEKPGDGES